MKLVSTDPAMWREELCRKLLRLDFEPAHEESFRGSIEPILISDGLRLVVYSHTKGAVFRDKYLTDDGNDDLVLLIPAKTTAFIKHYGNDLCVRPGQAAIMRNSEVGRVACKADNSVFALMLTPSAIQDLHENLCKSAGHALPQTRNLVLLRSYIKWMHRNATSITPEAAPLFGQKLTEFVKICCSADASSANKENDLAGARIQSAINFIAQNFHDCDLSERDLAVHQGISIRYLQKLFEKESTSFVKCLTEHRLQAARALLESKQGDRTLSEIALTVGYNDLSNFHRMFKKKFGETPTDARRRWLKEY